MMILKKKLSWSFHYEWLTFSTKFNQRKNISGKQEVIITLAVVAFL